MSLPAQGKEPFPSMVGAVGDALGCEPLEVLWREGQRHGLAVLRSPSEVASLKPDLDKVRFSPRPTPARQRAGFPALLSPSSSRPGAGGG